MSMHWSGKTLALAMALGALSATPGHSLAQPSASASAPTYADLADLADSAPFVVKATVRKLARVAPGELRSPVAPGRLRHFVSARTQALLAGGSPIGLDFAYLADIATDARGRPSIGKKSAVLVFARPVAGHPAQLQLVAPDAQIAWSPNAEATLRAILRELVAPDAPPRITSVREAIYVPGALQGEGETQIFLGADGNAAASLAIRHRPGMAPDWGVSFSELAAEPGTAPAPETLAWYRLACFLPAALPVRVNHSATAADRAQAAADYRLVLDQLGECPRSRRQQ